MNAPTLLIGLGGTGCKIIERVSKMVTDEQRNNISFVAFDTDINELMGIQERNPFIKIIQTSTKQSVGQYLNIDKHARDTWFPVNAILNGKQLSEGAGQVRSISRLALETAIRAGLMEPLHEAIYDLFKMEEAKADQALRVVLVSSLAGGTGSGLILPVALYVRNYLKTHFRQNAEITRGFFILPEVFYEVISGQTERNHLKSNAYATLRELDAFLMKGDSTLDEKYFDSVKMEFPIAASDGYEEYDVRPYDFCFLFDAQNAKGNKLNSFDQYLEHAANCIFAQSIGPMNKRSNSSEDNVIRKIAKEKGRNRYAGAGASMLLYPFTDVRDYIALKWAKQCVSKGWLLYDDLYKEIKKENNRKREEGIPYIEQSLSQFYVNQVDGQAQTEDPLAKIIVRASGKYQNGVTRTSNKYDEYVDCVEEKVKKSIQEGNPGLKSKYQGVNALIDDLENDWADFAAAFTALEEYRLMALAYVNEVSYTISYSMFRGSKNDGVNSDQDFVLEKYLVNADGSFMHPNAIRYMLIKIFDTLKQEKEDVDGKRDKNKEFFDSFVKNTFDNADTETEETAADLTSRKVSIISKITNRPTGDQEDIRDKYKQYLKKVEEFEIEIATSTVLAEGMRYVKAIIDSFESFYKIFDSKLTLIDKQIDEISKRYSDRKGSTVRFVCATKACLDKIYDSKPFTGSSFSIDSELAKEIYDKVLNYALFREKPNNNRYFNDIFDNGIINYFKNSVMRTYGSELDIDVISALEKEAEYTLAFEEKDNVAHIIDAYVRKTITDTRELSCPFIESPLGEPKEPIYACTFNIELKPDKGDESPEANLIRKELLNYGGEPAEEIPQNLIMFYQSFYGLRANNLSKFAPPEVSLTYNRTGGEYFKAYYELVEGIHPETHRSREISPHIDRLWHIVTKMPDLDDDNQKKLEYKNYAAFFWALMNRYIYLSDENPDTIIYKLNGILLNMDDERLVVSNGTDCDKLYEVLDSIAIYPELIENILGKVASITKDDVNELDNLEDGMLYNSLKTFRIAEPGIGPDNLASKSIFDIPMLMKKSATPDLYDEGNVIEMLRIEIEEIKKYLACFTKGQEQVEKVGAIIMDQFNLHLDAVEIESKKNPSIYRESLFRKVSDTIISEIEKMGMKKEANSLKEKIASLRDN